MDVKSISDFFQWWVSVQNTMFWYSLKLGEILTLEHADLASKCFTQNFGKGGMMELTVLLEETVRSLGLDFQTAGKAQQNNGGGMIKNQSKGLKLLYWSTH
uniref:Uncharacterized protein n=1 Tax=Micrurus carvalhoi TaxID=3147026 RepID=A0A2H6NBY3_9SAUR